VIFVSFTACLILGLFIVACNGKWAELLDLALAESVNSQAHV